MTDFDFIKTRDGSWGLFSNTVNDIYHAREGAYSESVEKFCLPAINFIKEISLSGQLKLCDICYGLGYNTTSFLEYFLCDNISDNFSKVYIEAFELDEELVILSPFLKNNNIGFCIRNFLFKSIKKLYPKSKITEIINKYSTYTDNTKCKHFKGGYQYSRVYKEGLLKKKLFLHNTYYNYISTRFKKAVKLRNIKKISFKVHIGDARNTITKLQEGQNIVFLDAFDPKKLPTLWTKEFFDLLYSKSDDKFKLFTYSHAACVRAAMIESKFYVGNNFGKGTTAYKNIKYINDSLSEYESGLLNTSAGICFRDYNLNGTTNELIQDRLRRVKLENRESSTHYAKTHQK